MPDIRSKLIDLFEWIALIAGTVTLLIKSLHAILTNRKSVKKLAAELEDEKEARLRLEEELEEYKQATGKSIEMILHHLMGGRK